MELLSYWSHLNITWIVNLFLNRDLFVDRIESQDEIHKLIEEVFG